MRCKLLIVASVIIMGIFALLSEKLFSPGTAKASGAFYDFTVNSVEGEPVSFVRYRGKNVLVVNTASKCGYTPQYQSLQKLHELYGDRLEVLAFPSNNFLWQEPGTNEEIARFCQSNYGVTCQLFEKISVRGRDQHPLYQWLAAKSGKKPSWNFCKYFINREGVVTGFFGPKVDPLDEAILKHINP
jgi:glutathione peroxidase